MVTNDSEARGNEMGDEELDETLQRLGYGTLALARSNEAYGIPVSFGYDGDRIFIYLIRFGDNSKKIDFAEQTERACLIAQNVESKFDWKSVVVTGTLHEVADDETEYMESVMDDNSWHPSLYASVGGSSPITGVRRTELRIESATGRKGEEYLD